ncbi:MAG: TIGR01212 family radical SAM protein [Clostridiales bacterium]|nr:TIGR01212 family radical SAM protein [Clostridiales bacterium]MBS5878369.1 TIGR01212 family radical SAM protein [Clostridiales bacterium]MDU3489532.1 TIGR01212 family radical SAM protein [Clostridiales bacterium]
MREEYKYIRNEKYYYSFPDYCKETFGRKLYRIALDIGTTCPNRDGKLGYGGCIFCSENGSGDFSIKYRGQKIEPGSIPYLSKTSGKDGDYIAYFQSYTNTYGDSRKLYKIFKSAMEDEFFAGIAIATRPDCLGPEILDVLKCLSLEHTDKFIWVELGLQTIHKESADIIRRGYDLPVFYEAVSNLHKIGIKVITHVIIGLPGESEDMIYETVRYLNKAGIDGVKLQLLHYIKGTDLGRAYMESQKDADKKIKAMDKETYIRIIVNCIGRLSPGIVIHRLTGDGDRENLIAPEWSVYKKNILNEIRSRLKSEGIRQGNMI